MTTPAQPQPAIETLIATWRAKVASFRAGRDVIDMETEALCIEDCASNLEAILPVLVQERERIEAELLHWKTCSLCGEVMTAPGHCDSAESERVKGLEQMHEETLQRAETAEVALASETQARQEAQRENERLMADWKAHHHALLDDLTAEREARQQAERDMETYRGLHESAEAQLTAAERARVAAVADFSELVFKFDASERAREQAETLAATYKRDFDAELDGNARLRKEFGAKDHETMPMFIARLAKSETEREALRTALLTLPRIVPSELEGDESSRTNGEYVYLPAVLAALSAAQARETTTSDQATTDTKG